MISKIEEQIYNSHLLASRSAYNKPTRFRKNFKSLPEKDVVCLKKLARFFNSYKNINYNDWFIAPYKVYDGNEQYFDLHYYTTRKALKCYTMYMKQKQVSDPDSDEVITQMREGLSFIYHYCIKHNMTLDEYRVSSIENIPTVIAHLKEHKINFYMLHLLEVDAIIKIIEPAILNFIVNDFWTIFSQTRSKFANSKKLKQKTREIKIKIKQKLVENKKQ